MRRLLPLSFLTACVALCAAPAFADTVELTGWTYGSGATVNVHVADTAFDFEGLAGGFSGTLNGDPLAAYCVELNQEFHFGTAYSYTPVGAAFPVQTLQDLGRLVTQDSNKVVDANSSAAFQLALWEVLYEHPGTAYSLSSGNFTDTGNGTARTLANGWLNDLSLGLGGNLNVQVLHNAEHQDFLVMTPVPEPTSYAMFGAGIAMLGAMSLRKRK